MIRIIYKILGVGPQEGVRVILLLVMGFFMGIFLATWTVASETLFLGQFDEQKDLPLAILISGGVGLIVTFIYSFLLTRVRFTVLVMMFVLLIAIVATLFTAGFYEFENTNLVIFASFVAIGPFVAILLLIFWGLFGRLFDLREAKRIIGSIDTGMLVASILALFSIPFVLRLLVNTYDLYIISAASVFLVMITLAGIAIKYNINMQPGQEKGTKIKRLSYVNLLKKRYTLLMASFVMISMVCVAFVDFSFLNVVSVQFPEERDLAGFLAYFNGTVVIFSFLFQTFFTDRIIAMYGLRVSLIANPILLAGFTMIAIFTGTLFGYTVEATNFIIFFMIISMSKLFLDSLKDALDGPSFKLYFLPISSEVRFDVQTKIEGVINVFAGLLAGGFILMISNIEAFNLLSLSFFLIPLVIGWYFVTDRMFSKYKDTLKETLEKNKDNISTEEDTAESSKQVLEGYAKSDDPDMVLMVLNVMEKIEPAMFDNIVLTSEKTSNKEIQKYCKKKIEEYDILSGNGGDKGDLTEKLASESLKAATASESKVYSAKELSRMSKSPDPKERLQTAKLLKRIYSEEYQFVLLEILRDINPEVKLAAINTARYVKDEETWPLLIDLMGTINFCHHAEAALIACGDAVIPVLEKAFDKSGQKAEIMFRIIRIYGRIGTAMGMKALWDKIDYPDKAIRDEILFAYKNNSYQVQDYKKGKIRDLLEEELAYTLWNLAALDEVADVDANQQLKLAFEVEIGQNYDKIYMLLGLLFDPQSVNLVRKNIESGTTEGIAFGLELLDIFIATDLKSLLFPILDDMPTEERLHTLQDDFPREKYNNIQVLYEIINRNYNQINRWTKACAVYSLSNIPKIKVNDSLLAQLFNPDPLLRETAAWFIFSKNKEAYKGVSRRIREDIKRELDYILLNAKFLNQVTTEMPLRLEKVMWIMGLQAFDKIEGFVMADLVDLLQVKSYHTGDIVFDTSVGFNFDMIIVIDGKIQMEGENGFTEELRPKDVFSGVEPTSKLTGTVKATVIEDCRLFLIEKGNLFDLLSRKEQLARRLIRNKEKRMISHSVET